MASTSPCGLRYTPYDESPAAPSLTGQSPRSMDRACSPMIRLPRTFDLGLTRPGEGYPNILLSTLPDPASIGHLRSRQLASRCLCTPVTVAQQNLRIDYTTLLQVAFPALPNDLAAIVDVQLATVPPFWQVPVTPAGMLPLASYSTELTRACRTDVGSCQYQAIHLPPGRTAVPRQYQCRVRQQQLHLDCLDHSVARARSWSAVRFEPAVRGCDTPDARLQQDLGRRTADSAGIPPVASAPHDDETRRPWRLGMLVYRSADRCCRAAQCRRATERRHNAAALARRHIEREHCTAGPDHPSQCRTLHAAPDATFRSAGPAVRETQFWTFRADQPHPGWEPRDWPTPVPRQYQLRMPTRQRWTPLFASCRR